MKISKLHTFAIISYFFAIRIEASTAERFGYYDPFSDGFLAEGVSSVNVLISEDLQKQLSNVIVAVVFSDTILEPVSDTFCLRSGEVIVEQRVSIPDFLGVNLVRDDNDLYQNKNKINFSYPSETVTSDINIRQSFRIRSNDNGSPFKDSRFYCIGFSLADGQVQIIDFETIRRKMCPNHEPENGKEVFYKTFSQFKRRASGGPLRDTRERKISFFEVQSYLESDLSPAMAMWEARTPPMTVAVPPNVKRVDSP